MFERLVYVNRNDDDIGLKFVKGYRPLLDTLIDNNAKSQ